MRTFNFYETVVDVSKARSRQRWLSLFSLDDASVS